MSSQSYLLGLSLQKMVSFVKCMLGLDAVVWDIIGSSLLEKVVYLLTELDVCSFPFVWLGNLYYNFFFSYWLIGIMQVNITWEDILQDEHNKGFSVSGMLYTFALSACFKSLACRTRFMKVITIESSYKGCLGT